MEQEISLQNYILMFDFDHTEIPHSDASLGNKFDEEAKHYMMTITHRKTGRVLKTPFSMGAAIAKVFPQPDPVFVLSCLQMEAYLGFQSYKEAMEVYHENFEGAEDSKNLYKHWENVSKWFFTTLGDDFESFCKAEVMVH